MTATAAAVQYYRPQDTAELYAILEAAPDDALILSGGMTAMPYINRGEWTTSCVVSVTAVPELNKIRLIDNAIVIGAATTHTDLTLDPLVAAHVPVLADAAAAVGDVQIRNRGTIGGTVAFANSGADHVTTLAALDAVVVLGSTAGVRRVSMRTFVTGRRTTVRRVREVVLTIEVPLDETRVSAYLRLTRVQGASPVLTLVACRDSNQQVLCIGGATARPVLLNGNSLFNSDDELRKVVHDAVTEPIGDQLSPPAYRHAMASELAVRVVQKLRDRTKEKGPYGEG